MLDNLETVEAPAEAGREFAMPTMPCRHGVAADQACAICEGERAKFAAKFDARPSRAPQRLGRKGLCPSPVYEALLSDNSKVRLSFFSVAGKPIDIGRGRRAIEAIVFNDPDETKARWARVGGVWKHLPARLPGFIVAGRAIHNGKTIEDPGLIPGDPSTKRRAQKTSPAAMLGTIAQLVTTLEAADLGHTDACKAARLLLAKNRKGR